MNSDRKRKKILYIVIPIVAAIVILAAAASYYYFFYEQSPSAAPAVYSGNNYITGDTDGTVVPGQEITYSINIENSSSTDITGIRIKALIPEGTEFLSADGPHEYDEGSRTLVFELDSLKQGSSVVLGLTARVSDPIEDGAEIRLHDVEVGYFLGDAEKDFVIESDAVDTVKSSPELTIENLDLVDKNGGEINSGDILRVSMDISNSGNMIASDVGVHIMLDQNLRLLNASTSSQVIALSDEELQWLVASVDTEDRVGLNFEVMPIEGLEDKAPIQVDAVLTYDGEEVDKESIEGTVRAFADLSSSSIEVADLNGGNLWAGDVLRYTLTIRNSGLRQAEDFKVYCPSPDNTFYVSGSGTPEGISWDDDIRGIVWDIESLDAAEELVLTLDFTVSDGLTGGGYINTDFYIIDGETEYSLESISSAVSSYIFQTVVAMGDSHIVHTNWQNTLDSLLENTYPRAEFNTIGSGVPQEMAYQGVRRFDSTVAVYNPQIIIIGYGTNDTGGGLNLFRNGLDELVKKAKGTGATVLVHSIGYIDKTKRPAKKSFLSYNEVIREVCSANGVPYIDLYTPMAQDPGRYLDSDGMHWSAEGGSLLAHLVYNTLVNYLDSEGRRK